MRSPILTRREVLFRFRQIRLLKRTIPVIWIGSAVSAVIKVFNGAPTGLSGVSAYIAIYLFLPLVITIGQWSLIRTHRLTLQISITERLLKRNRELQEERDALRSEKASMAARAGNSHNRELQKRARLYYESNEWPTKAAAIADLHARFNRSSKTVERWISKWTNELNRDDA